MAKKPVASDTAQEEEFSVVVLKFKGSGETARKGIDAAIAAIAGLAGVSAPVKQVNGRKTAALPAVNGTDALEAETVDTDTDTDGADDTQEQTDTAAAAAAGKGTPRPRKLPKFDDKLAVTPFKAFAAERNPQTIDEKYLVACLWLQEDASLASYGASQVFTCFRAMGDWPTYDDFTQPMRQMKQKKSYFADTEKRGDWKLTDHGLDEARKIKHSATA